MIDLIKKVFGTKDVYKVLGLSKEEANDARKLRNAYLRSALAYHPDKAGDNSSTEKFQVMKQIYDVLKDPESKKIYDETGEWPTDEDETYDFEATKLGRLDEETIESFKKEYQGSDEERNDIIKYYNEGKGSLIHVFDNVFFINVIDDEERVKEIIDSALEAGDIEEFPEDKSYARKWKAYVNKAKKEAKESEEMMKELQQKMLKGASSSNGKPSLQAMIRQRGESGGNFLDQLEAKYGGASEKKKRKVSKK